MTESNEICACCSPRLLRCAVHIIAYRIPKVIVLYSTEDIDLLGYNKRHSNAQHIRHLTASSEAIYDSESSYANTIAT